MRKRPTYGLTIAFGLLTAAACVGVAVATPGLATDAVVLGRGAIEDNALVVDRDARRGRAGPAMRTDVLFQFVTMAPGGHTGWHSHPSETWVLVTKGELTHYLGDDRACLPHVFRAGTGFFQPSGEVHIARNEGSVPAEFYVFYTGLRGGQPARTDEALPGNCAF